MAADNPAAIFLFGKPFHIADVVQTQEKPYFPVYFYFLMGLPLLAGERRSYNAQHTKSLPGKLLRQGGTR